MWYIITVTALTAQGNSGGLLQMKTFLLQFMAFYDITLSLEDHFYYRLYDMMMESTEGSLKSKTD